MTHGAGSLGGFSGGGGGGFSGGGFIYHGNHNSSRKGNDDDNALCWCIGCIFIAIGSLFGFLFCLCPMKWQFRVTIIWAWMILISSTTGLLLTLVFFPTSHSTASPGDTIPITEKVDTSLCSGLHVKSLDKINMYLMEKYPELQNETKTQIKTFSTSYISRGDYEYFGFFLLPGSSITINTTESSYYYGDMELYVIKGKSNFESWKKKYNCRKCTYFKRKFSLQYPMSINITNVPDADHYYIAFANSISYDSWKVKGSFILDRTLFNTSDAILIKKNTKDAKFDLKFKSKQTVVLQYPENIWLDWDTLYDSTCLFRWSLLLPLIIVLPVLIGIGLSLLVWLYFKDKNVSMEKHPVLQSLEAIS